jgi:hypothetical protein
VAEPAKDTRQGEAHLDLRARTIQTATGQHGAVGSRDLGSGGARRCLPCDHVASRGQRRRVGSRVGSMPLDGHHPDRPGYAANP